MKPGPSQPRRRTRRSPRARVEIVATRDIDEQPERWTMAIGIEERRIDAGTFPSLAKALITGIRLYYESRLPPHFRRKHKDLLD
jgi:hypothetical protein